MPVRGYEMHLGVTTGLGLETPMLELNGHPDGAISADGCLMGCYLHGLFASDPFRRAFLARLGAAASPVEYEPMIDSVLDALADHLERNLDIAALLVAARPPRFIQAA
jgi:adenosylcobyric acid synthase